MTRFAAKFGRWLVAGAVGIGATLGAPAVQAQDAAALHARHEALREALAKNDFGRPLVLESTQTSGDLKGDVYALVDKPYALVGPALQRVDHWCDILILHLNVKHCTVSGAEGADKVLHLRVGRKFDQPLADTYLVSFAYKVQASTPDYLRVQLDAGEGPMGTKNYRIVLEATPLDAKSSFIHMSYSYAYGVAARLAMQGYLGTVGRDKIGFSVVGRKANGEPEYVDNVRGVVERNTMRYYLAIDSFLGALSLPPEAQLEKRLNDWYAGNERYARQLHEVDRDEYMAMKHKEVRRQQTPSVKAD